MKVQPFQIVKPLNENLIIQVDGVKGFYNKLHQHNEIQLSQIVKGFGKLVIGDSVHQFQSGDIFAIGSNCPHLFKTEEKQGHVQMISLFFTPDTFGKEFFTIPDLSEIKPFFDLVREGFQVLSKKHDIGEIFLDIPKVSKTTRVVLFIELLQHLVNAEKSSLTSFTYPKEIGNLAGNRMQIVFDYVLHHFHEQVKLDEVSSLVHMTPNAFCKFFKQRTDKTFFQFLIELRIEHSSQLLRNQTDLSIAEISERSGFKSISNFNRKFKASKGVVPSQYKKAILNLRNQ
ncbi:AraC family transcriptional regulator [Maribacter algarum]|uniref:AraC family transcriptional regulator n=1 Tax=Maribacter algarum (ex Zhang et al. 2020) TaxID=2578118 RepID=A0A5S3PS72_9FLAO|nr:AraC family transcriptional regulator [Maribacter algarum]TMM57511.1 AraC family transcriptional regulator [Maribacter algarum]